ncbi:carbon-nitrogen hydrolase family protein [Erwinia psidii]|uniref:Carbon-nitrogen hydrolase family protein n=1 Tax=Erwinia psidii TaxID=69224 RepID=A0A3N6RUI5_9GAMM|nr:carbon-nitrogen hydrolase family protein [Erwinia psidii]MCX8965936.1 carbon-nitrogen hydrolase family protein [Erwinia psidii]RQM36638.1 carbon-nitrogen hydrolase family protein [Erwinia psidii]
MSVSVVAALQMGSHPEGKTATLAQIISYEEEIRRQGISLVVMPEALLGGYPKGSNFGTWLGFRLPEGREAFAAYYATAIDVPGEECDALAAFSARCGADVVIGVIERDGSTLYCSSLFFSPKDGLVAKHRKLMPTGTERLIWGQGDGSTLPVVEMAAGKVGCAICWENHMPLLRAAMYAKGVQIWCAPTVDERDVWRASMRHIAHEGRCFVITACQMQPTPNELGTEVPGWDPDRVLINGNSMIVGPLGEVLAGPMTGVSGLLTAKIDTAELVRARYDFDVSGHYSRPDVFFLTVDERAKHGVVFLK